MTTLEAREQYRDPRDLLRTFLHLDTFPKTMRYGKDDVRLIACDFETGFLTVVRSQDMHEPDWESRAFVVSPYQVTVEGVPLLDLAEESHATRTALHSITEAS